VLRLLTAIFLIVVLAPQAMAQSEPRTLRVGLYDNAPKIYRDADGKAQGFWPELMRTLAERNGWQLEWVSGTWSEHMTALAEGRLDIMPDVAKNPERSQRFLFNQEVALVSWSRIYAADPDTETLPDLTDKRVAVLSGSINYRGEDGIAELLAGFQIPVTFVEKDSYEAVFQAVRDGEADAGVTNKDFGNLNEARYGLHQTPIIFGPAALYFALPRNTVNSDGLRQQIDRSLAELKQDNNSEYYTILDQTLGVRPDAAALPEWLLPASMGAGLAVFLLMLGNLVLKRRVRKHEQALASETRLKTAAEEALANREIQLRSLVDHSPSSIFIKNLAGEYEVINPHFEKLLGMEQKDILGKTDDQLFSADEYNALKDNDAMVIAETKSFCFEETLTLGERAHVFLTTKFPLFDLNGAITGLCGIALDITQQKEHQAEIHFLAHHDMLTRLPNRRRLEEFVQMSIDECRETGQSFALAFIDLTRFKSINDSLGHAAGDRLLQVISQRIRESLRTDDFVARVGGDEFVIILKNVRSNEDLEEVLQKITRVFEQPVSLNEKDVRVGVSVGTALFPQDAESPDTLMRNADTAMYHAKTDGGDVRTRQYFPELTEAARQRFEMEEALRAALDNDEFHLVYQPQIDLASGRMAAVEALVRWQRPGHGMVSPGEFIPVAEAAGLINELDNWVLNEACRQARAWSDAGLQFGRISVNLSAIELSGEHLADRILAAIRHHDILADHLGIEVTESMLMENIGDVYERLRALSEAGVFIAIDDFGTGYSSLSYLKRLTVNELKIDKSFIDDLPDQDYDRAICETIIQMGRHLGLEVIAEGVETQQQADYLLTQGCQRAQGYWFARPLPAVDLEEWLH
jgi:diguanylate cyclase (GGDEF)-like protein/PAS domain S-box-containing protein